MKSEIRNQKSEIRISKSGSGVVLGIDAVSAVRGAAIVAGEDLLALSVSAEPPANLFAQRRDDLMPLVAEAMAAAGCAAPDLAAIAITLGPGSYTGIRMGLALLRGLTHGTKVRGVGVDTLEAMAALGKRGPPATPAVQVRRDEWIVRCGSAGESYAADDERWPAVERLCVLGRPPAGFMGEARPLATSLAEAVARLGAAAHAAGESCAPGELRPLYSGDRFAP